MLYNFTIVLQNVKTADQQHLIMDVDPYRVTDYFAAWELVVEKAKKNLKDLGMEWKIFEIRHNN